MIWGQLKDLGATDQNKVTRGLEKKYLNMILLQGAVVSCLKKFLFQMVLNAIVAIF